MKIWIINMETKPKKNEQNSTSRKTECHKIKRRKSWRFLCPIPALPIAFSIFFFGFFLCVSAWKLARCRQYILISPNHFFDSLIVHTFYANYRESEQNHRLKLAGKQTRIIKNCCEYGFTLFKNSAHFFCSRTD